MRYFFPAIFIILVLVGILYFYSLNKSHKEDKKIDTVAKVQEFAAQRVTEDKLIIEDIKIGDGYEARNGNNVSVHYTGKFLNGRKFDSSLDRGQPFSFNLGQGQVIKGWDEGILGMKVGGKRKLTIPPSLAYGENGVSGAIPPNSTLLFDVELLNIK